MINQLLIEEVFGQPLCIESNYAQSMAVLAYSAFASNKPLSGIRYEAAYAVVPQSGAKQTSGTYSKGSVGVVVMDNPIVQNSDPWYGIKGTIEAAQELQALDADPNIIGTVLCMNSGGGAVYAIKPIADVLSGLQKPVVTFSKQLIASAAYRIGASTDHIMMYHPQGIAGSLGTMMSMSDMQPMFEKWGMTFHDHYATASILKNKTFTDAQKGDAKALRANMLDPMNDLFIADIKRLRGDKISADEKSIYQGETFLADPQSLSLGLIDSMGTLTDAVQKVVELSGSASSKSSNTSQNKSTEMKTEAIAALAGKTDPSQEELDLANANLTEAGITGVSLMPDSVVDAAAQVTKDKELLETANATLKTDLAAANAKVTSLTSENTILKAKVASAPAVVAAITTDTDPKTTLTAEEEAAAKSAGYGHNQYINQLLGEE